MANKINSKDINLISSYKKYNNKGKSSSLKKISIIFVCIILIGGIVTIGYLFQNKKSNLENEINVLENYVTNEDNILQSSKNAELKVQLNNLRAKVDEINKAISIREASQKIDNAIIGDIVSSIGQNDKIEAIVYDRVANSLNVRFSLTGEISSYDVVRNLKAKPKFKDVQFNTYQYAESKSVYEMAVSILLTAGKE